MSTIEIIVILFGLYLGYWVVSKLLGDGPPAANTGPKQESDTAAVSEEPNPGWADVLQIPATADANEIRSAYKSLMGQYHPDKVASLGKDLQELAEKKSKEITEAYRAAMKERGALP